MNLKKSVPNFSNVSNQKSCFCARKKMFCAQKTKFYTSFFKGAKNREIQKTEKMDLRHLIFWGCLKSAIFWRKTNADATTVGSGPGRLPLACMRKLTFPLWELTFPSGEIVFPSSGTHVSLKGTHVSFRGTHVSFKGTHVSFR